jgi:nicotinate-nucleotide pyrophosphorylase (carboxylating)
VLNPIAIHAAVQLALGEDLHSGDVTTRCTVPEGLRATAAATAKSPLVVCGGEVFAATFLAMDPNADVKTHLPEGAGAEPGQELWTVTGLAAPLLMAERSALNLTQRMSGIATLAKAYVNALPANSRTRITDTRKTTPGLRALERYAVRTGGAHNHRDNLGSAVLIKDNHIKAAGGIKQALESARRLAPHVTKIEVEVVDLRMLTRALDAGADIVMLDNFDADAIHEAVILCQGRAQVEVSGGITLERIEELAELGVDLISVGALTHSAPAADISLNIVTE